MRGVEEAASAGTVLGVSSVQATTWGEPKDISLSDWQATVATVISGQLTHLFYVFYCFKFQDLRKRPHLFHCWHKRYISFLIE